MTKAHYFTARDWLSAVDLDRSTETVDITACGVTLRFATGLGTFSRGELDFGSRLLLETVFQNAPSEGSTLCDLGCGWGALMCFAAKLWPASRVVGCDLSAPAAQLARLNARTNALSNCSAMQGDGLAAARGSSFDVVLCNPPVRAGNAVIARLFADAHRCLKPNGVLWVVLRTQQGAKSWQKRLATQFDSCETIVLEKGFRVLRSTKN